MCVGRQLWKPLPQVIRHVLRIPLEAATAPTAAELELRAQVAGVQVPGQWLPGVEERLVPLVEPSLDDALVVLCGRGGGGGRGEWFDSHGAAGRGGTEQSAVSSVC